MSEFNETKPIRVEARIKNNVLYQAIHCTHKSIKAFCRQFGLSYIQVMLFINLKESPLLKTGEFKQICIRLSNILGVSPTSLFPFELYQVEKTMIVREYSFTELPAAEETLKLMPAPDSPLEDILRTEISDALQEAIKLLNPREQKIIEMYYGLGTNEEHNLDQIAEKFGITRERIRQIKYKAISKLSEPCRSSKLKSMLS